MARTALITGSGKRRVGNAIASLLASRGFDIAVHYHTSADDARDTCAELQRAGVRAAPFRADLRSEAEISAMLEAVYSEFGRLDALVTAHGSWPAIPFESTTGADLMRQFEIEVLGTFLCCQRVGLRMAGQAEGGAIVTIGDWAVARPYAGYAAYFAAKGSIPTLTRTLAVELAARNPAVRVNCILPGPVMVPEHVSGEEKRRIAGGTLV